MWCLFPSPGRSPSPSKKVAQILLQGLRSPPYRSSRSARISPSRSRGLVMADRGRRALPIGNRLTNDRWVSHCQVCYVRFSVSVSLSYPCLSMYTFV